VESARRLFAARGFAATSLEDILQAVGMTRGALYHHFEGKAALFREVYEAQEHLLMQKVAAAAERERQPWAAVRAGCEAFLDACVDHGTQQIILIDAPGVLGWEVMREIKSRHAMSLIREGLQASIQAGQLRRRPVDPLAHMLLGALSESAMAIARAQDPTAMAAAARKEIRHLLQALAAPPH
jgi:AcrR family transcriptional regulator